MPSRKKKSSSHAQDRYLRPSTRAAAGPPRTIVHLSMPQELMEGVNALLWMRITATAGSVEAIRKGKGQIYDEAVEAFLQLYEQQPCEELKAAQLTQGWTSLWIDHRLYTRCKRVAKRENVSIGRVVGYAMKGFIERIVKPECRVFARQAAERARELLAAEPDGLGAAGSSGLDDETPVSRARKDRQSLHAASPKE